MASDLNDKSIIRIGSRKSQLALIQTNIVLDELQKIHPEKTFAIVPMSTKGDEILDKPLAEIGSKSLFTKELEIALCNNDIDLIVHSLKDLPTNFEDTQLTIGAICAREDPRDAVILHPKHKNSNLQNLPNSSVIGTSSVRRNSQLKMNFPHLKFKNIRGNLNTRLRKLEENDEYDAIILAVSGIIRMGWEKKISQYLTSDECMYAVGQGALAVECRSSDVEILALIKPLRHLNTTLSVLAERAFMNTLEGGCSVPLAVESSCVDGKLCLKGAVFSVDGNKTLKSEVECVFHDDNVENGSPPKKLKINENQIYVGIYNDDFNISHKFQSAFKLGIKLANQLRTNGADTILKRNNEQK